MIKILNQFPKWYICPPISGIIFHHRGWKWKQAFNIISTIQHTHMCYKLLLQPHILNLRVLVPHLFIADFTGKKRKEKKHSPQTGGHFMVDDTLKSADFLKLTSVIIFPLVLFLSLWLARFCFCCKTLSLVVRYSRANSLMILQNLFMFTSRIA